MREEPADMRSLVDRLNETAHSYYVLDKPLISDAQWDRLYDRLLRMEQEEGFRFPDSPTLRVGGEPLPAFVRHRHISRLWSMDKVQSPEELGRWFERTEALCAKAAPDLLPLVYGLEYKFDGLTLNLTYRDGYLVQAATRGNGEVGEGILEQARTIRDIPLRIPYRGLLEIHGECVMRLSALREYNKTAREPLKNARNAAAGALRNLDPGVTAQRRLSTFFYGVGTIEDPPFKDQEGLLAFIRDNGFSVSPGLLSSTSHEALVREIDRLRDTRHGLDYLTDGVVIKVGSLKAREFLGYTDKFPRWAVAYKYAAEETTTTLNRVTWDPGRTGKLSPLGHVEPVEFSGVTVRRATLNNWGDIQRKGLGLGCTVWIRRSNDVIPEITGRVEDGAACEPIAKPETCPACGTALKESGAHLFCPNRLGCRPQIVARIVHYASRDGMNIETLSDKTVELLADRLGLQDPAGLYSLTEEALLTLPGFKEKRARNLLHAIAASRDCALDAFLYALGIQGIGRAASREIALALPSLEKIRSANRETLLGIDSIGELMSEAVLDYFADPYNARMLEALQAAGVRPHPPAGTASGALQGLVLVVTGTLKTLSRAKAEELIRSRGGIPSGSVSRNTSYLVCGENPGSKLDRAQALRIPILSEEEFLRLAEAPS